MSDIRKTDLDARTYCDHCIIMARNDLPDRTIRIFHFVDRLYRFHIGGTLCLSVFPLCFLHLYMRTVTKHDAAKLCAGFRCIHSSPEASRIQKRQHTGMIHMCMGQKHIIDQRFLYRKIYVFKYIFSLLHTVINKNMLTTRFEIMTASRHLMICPNKFQFHAYSSLNL